MLDDAKMIFEEMIGLEIKPSSTILEASFEIISRKEEASRVGEF
jgi:hypothetical protein